MATLYQDPFGNLLLKRLLNLFEHYIISILVNRFFSYHRPPFVLPEDQQVTFYFIQ